MLVSITYRDLLMWMFQQSIVFLLFFVFSTVSNAQELYVKDMYVDEHDISGSTYARRDANGDYCSLIKVQTNLTNCAMTFSGNVFGNIDDRKGEYWIYVTPGTKMLRIKCQNYLPIEIKFSDFGVNRTEQKRTYVISVLGQNIITPTTETKMQSLTIKYSPSNAVVKINGADMESVGGTFKTFYPIGKYTYEISAPGYVSKSEVLDLSSKEPVNINIALQTLTQIQESQLQEAEVLYKKAISFLHLGQDENAEEIAIKCVNLGSEKGYEIITALFLHGFYDDNRHIPIDVNGLYDWQMKKYHVSGNELLKKRYNIEMQK